MQNNNEMRTQVYQFFQRQLSAPLEERDWKALILWSKQTDDFGFLQPIAHWICHHEHQADLIQDLSIEFTKLFAGLSEAYGPIPPYEALYLGEALFTSARSQEVLAYYQDFACTQSDPYGKQSDHIANLLGFVAELIGQQNTSQTQLAFLQRHVIGWIKPWKNSVREFEQLGYYSSVIESLEAFIRHDIRELESLLCVVTASA